MGFRKKSKAAASTPTPVYSNPPTMGARSDMPSAIQRSPQFKIGLTDQEQRDEGKARLKAQYPGTSESYGRSLYRPGENPSRSRGGSTLDRPARDYQ
jgi:hypothetical protein